MPEAKAKRRGHGEDAIYFAAEKNRYVGRSRSATPSCSAATSPERRPRRARNPP
jgi:hypothetical protein